MKLAILTEAQADAVAAIVDKALSYPKPGVHVGGGLHVNMPPTWNKTGPTPPGWSYTYDCVWLGGSDAAYRIEDALAALIAAAPNLSAAEKLQISSKLASRIDAADFDTRTPKRPP